jgi:xylulokinase
MSFVGIDLGTSALKAIIVDETQSAVAEAEVPIASSRPRDLWSEQDPESWWSALQDAVARLRAVNLEAWSATRAIGLS